MVIGMAYTVCARSAFKIHANPSIHSTISPVISERVGSGSHRMPCLGGNGRRTYSRLCLYRSGRAWGHERPSMRPSMPHGSLRFGTARLRG